MKQFTFSAVMANNLLTVLQGCSKTIRLLLVMLLTLTVSANVWGAEKTYTHQFTTKPSIGNNTLSTITWGVEATNLNNYNNGYAGVQFGTKSTSGSITLTSANAWGEQSNTSYTGYTNVKYVYVWLNAGTGTPTATVTIGGKAASKSGAVTKNTSANGNYKNTSKLTFTPTSGGNTGVIVITASTPSKAGYIAAIEVVCETPAETCTTNPTVSAGSNSNINITSTTATVSCSSGITSLGSAGCSITSYGFVYGTTTNPTTSNTKVQVGTTYTTTGTPFSMGLTGLTANTTYYVRPYATNGNGTAYGTQTSFKTLELPKYTVTLNAGPGTCAAFVTEEYAGKGVTLPPPTLDGCGDWEFAGWKTTSAVTTETTTEPILIPAGAYSPTSDITLYAVYQRTETTQGGGSSKENVDFSSQGYTNQQEVSSYDGTNFSVAFNKGSNSNAPKYYTTGTAIRIYGGGYFTISSESTITKIEITFGSGEDSNAITASQGTYSNGTWTGSANSVKFTIGGSSGNRRIKSLAVTTTGGGSSTTYYHSTPDCGDPCASLQAPNVTATATANSITLSWDAVDGATSYNVYNYTTEEAEVVNVLTYTFNGLDPETEYAWEVEAVSATCNGKGFKGTTTTSATPCEQLGAATGLTVQTDFVQDGQTYVKFSWTPADNTKANATNQKICFGKVDEAGTCVDDLAKNLTWTGDLKSKLEPGEYWWSIQALGDGVNYCDGDVVNGTNFTIEAPTYTVTWMVNGEELISGVGGDTFTTNITGGNSILDLPDEPAAPAGCSTKVFVGWTTESIDSETDTPPSELFDVLGDFPPVTENVTYYAVWADEIPGSGVINKEDNLTNTLTGVSGSSYTTWYDKNGSSGTVYAGNSADNDGAIQLRSGTSNNSTVHSGIITTTSVGKATKIKVEWKNSTQSERTLDVYGKNDSKYQSVEDLYDAEKRGTKIGSIVCGTSTTLEVTGDYSYIGLRSADGAMYLNSIQITWATGTPTTYSAYTTICDNTKATITYNLDGGTGPTCEKTTVKKGEEFTLCNQTPTKTGYNFAGWSDGTRTYAAGATVTVDDHTTFYASWNAKSITITWDQNYTDCPEAANSTYIYDGEVIEIPADPTRVGYKFTGWFTASTDGTQVTEVGETNKPTADVIYYAHWAELYTVTFKASGQVYAKQEFKYLSGETLQLPADPSAANYACDGYIFDGWSETEKTNEDATKPTLISTPAITKDVTYYAVWKKATAEGAGETIFYESFDGTEGTGGNDGKWSGSIATSDAYVDNDGWEGDNFFGADQCMKLGSGSKKGYVITPALTNLSGNATLSFKAAAWNASGEKTTLVLSIEGGGSLSQTSVTLKKGAWQTYELTITGGTSNTQITFAGYQASDSRFFLDEVKVATSGSYNYTTSPRCGPTIVAKEGMWVTSTNAQSVKVNVPIAVKSFENNATITGTTANENFVVTPLENVSNGEHNVVVTYTPNAYDTKEDATITLTAKVGEETISTTTFTLNGRSLPEAFAVVVDKASTYFALPANMPEAGVYPGFNVSLNADKSAVVAAPKTHLYALKTVHKNRFDENGTCVRLEGNNIACLWATNAASGTHIRNWAQLNNADGAQYEWSLYTEDGDTYSISCAAVTEEGRILRMYGDNFGMYKSGASVFRLLPVECTEQPTNVLVSAARVAATIAWTNAATCDVKVYLKSNASLVKTLSGVASPVTVIELTETTEYTYTITPVGNVACEVSGEFKTTGPDIDIVEWMTDGVIIQVDKDEALNPKVVIKGEVEHNTGSGVMATELFFSKYFEAHGHNKLLAIYNGTGAPIDLSGYEIKSENGTLDLSQFGQTKGTVAPNEEIILVYYDATDNNNDNIPDYSAEPCAEEQEGYEKWNILTVQSVLAFSGRGSIGLYKDDELIDVIGSTFPSGELTKIGKSGNPDYCGEEEDIRLHIDGESVNDQSSFFCTNGDNIKTDEVEENYAISTNRCLLIRKNTVTSGEDAVTTNKAEAGATCGELSSTFKTLCSEWAGFRIGSGKSTSDEIKDATCDGLGYVGGFDYNKYYREFQTLDDSKTLDKFEYNLEENLYKLTIDNVAQYSCLNIQVQINDPVNGTVLTEETAQVPILVTAANTTTDELFSNIIDDDLDASRTRCSTCDVVVLDGATLTKAAAETANDVNQVRNLYVYPGGQLIVPETGNDYKVNSISFRRVEDAVANAQLSSNLNITASSEKPIYADVRVNAENWHWFTLPYDCNIADVTWVDGTPAKYGVDWFLSTYDGEKRAATQSGGCWAEFHGETIKAGVGYIVGIAGHPTKSKVKYELRFPMSKDVLAQEVEGTDKTVPVYAWGVDEDMRPTHKGWNLVGNPYLDYYQKNKLNSFGGLRLGGKYVLNQSTGYWEDSGKWDGVTGNLPYVVVPIDGGWSAYDQVLVSSIDLLPFTAYFVQVGNPETEDNGDLKDVMFDGDNRGRASIARRAPSSVSEQEEPVIVGVNLTNSKGESDMTSLVIDDKYTDEYEMNADFFKWFGDYYRYYTRPVVYTIGADKQQRAFNAINEEQAAKPVSMGTYTAQNGEYTFSLDRRSDLTRVKEVWLHDATESAYINLMQEDYSFSTGKTDGTGRFTLAVTLHPKSPTDITDGMNGQVYVTSQQRMLYVNNLPQQARVWVYDAVGKLLVNESTNVYQRAYHVGQAGVYFVRVESQNGCETLQVVVE